MNDLNFKGIWISKEIWFAKDISFIEKCLLMQIDGLSSPDKGCYASNAYFSELFQIDKRTLQRHLKSLKDNGYVHFHFKNPANKTGRTIYTYMTQQVKKQENNEIGTTEVSRATTEVSHHGTTEVSQVVISSNNKFKDKEPLTPFELFWESYPKKENKQQALRAFKAQKVNGNLEEIINDVRLRAQTDAWLKENGQYIPNPSTYLNNRKWEEPSRPVGNQEPF